MVNVLIMGSSGMVGSEVLAGCMANSKVKRITVVCRKKSDIASKKVKQIIHSDFLDFSKVKGIKNHDVIFYCVGVYQNAVPKDEFVKVTHGYLAAFSKAVESPKTTFCLFSAQWANPSSSILFEKWKGEAEVSLRKLKFKDIYIFRPGYIHPVDREKRKKTLFYRIVEFFYPLANIFLPWFCTNSRQLARTIVNVGLDGSERKVWENMDIRGFII
jgi:hypothetical protein